MGPHQGHVASRGVQLGTALVTCTSKTFRVCAACIDTDRTLIYTWKCFAVFSCLRRASLPSVDSAAILLLSSPVAACIDTDRTLIYTWKCFEVFSCLRRASLPSVDSAAILLLSSPVAEQYLTVEDGPLSPPGFRQQSSVAEHFLAVEDGFVSLPSILSQSSVNEQL